MRMGMMWKQQWSKFKRGVVEVAEIVRGRKKCRKEKTAK